MPDEIPRPASGKFGFSTKPQLIDAADDLAYFVSNFKDWVKEGKPRNWRYFVMGMSHRHRQRSRDIIDHFRAVNSAQGIGPERDEWVNDHKTIAGWG